MEIITWTRDVPLRYEADVAVIGGGIAGACAACAAARTGVRVILIERFGVTGGVLTSGGVGNWSGLSGGEGGVMDDILEAQAAWGSLEPSRNSEFSNGYEQVFDHEILALILQERVLADNVKLLLHARCVDVRAGADGEIGEAVVCGASGPEGLRARQWIDCTGEACVARAAGFAVMHGREEDNLCIPPSMMAFVRETDGPVEPQLPAGWFTRIEKPEDLPMTSVWPNGPGEKALKIKIPFIDSGDTESLSEGEIRARRKTMEVLDYYQRIERKAWRYDHCSPIIGIREGRRIAGDYVLTVDDLRAGREFDDAVARGVFFLDGLRPDTEKRQYMMEKEEMRVPPYQIPLRSLIARDGTNLTMAGRCFSCDQHALSSARVAPTGAMMGQAAGLLAARAVSGGTTLRAVDPAEVRGELERRGARIAL